MQSINSQKLSEPILAHPRFREAQRTYIDAFTGYYLADPFLVRHLIDAGSLTLSTLLVGFHAAHDERDRATWATPGRLQELFAGSGLASPRRLDHLISQFRHAGLAETVPSPSDGRVRLIKPTGRLIACDRAYEAALHRPLHVLDPHRGYAAVLRQDPQAHLAIRRAGVLTRPPMPAFLARSITMMFFFARHGGYLALLLVMRSLLAGKADDAATSYAALATRLGVSRSHVRKLFVDAAAAGFVALSPEGRRVTAVKPPLQRAFDRFVAEITARRAAIAQSALAAGSRSDRHRALPTGFAEGATR